MLVNLLSVEGWLYVMGEVLQLDRVPSLQTAKFAFAQAIDHEPAFNWRFKHMFKKKDRMSATVRKWQASFLKQSLKFVIEVSKTVEHALVLYAKNGNTVGQVCQEELQNF